MTPGTVCLICKIFYGGVISQQHLTSQVSACCYQSDRIICCFVLKRLKLTEQHIHFNWIFRTFSAHERYIQGVFLLLLMVGILPLQELVSNHFIRKKKIIQCTILLYSNDYLFYRNDKVGIQSRRSDSPWRYIIWQKVC